MQTKSKECLILATKMWFSLKMNGSVADKRFASDRLLVKFSNEMIEFIKLLAKNDHFVRFCHFKLFIFQILIFFQLFLELRFSISQF